MASLLSSLLFFLLSLSLTHATKQTYIVHMSTNHKPLSYATHAHWYAAHLHSLSINPTAAILYIYDSVLSGFAATLDSFEAESLRRSDYVLSIYTDSVYYLHTTRTPDFLGLNADMGHGDQADINQGTEDIVIGILDSGIWPESSSFDDAGMPKVPSRWHGRCEEGIDFRPSVCNRKLIGAKAFWKGMAEVMPPEGPTSVRDRDGHGTHAASIAAGSHVGNASLFGYATGTARGMAPRARIAVYKVCWELGCFGSDILAGIDAAIADGVDILSLSLGAIPVPYKNDPISIGTFAAVDHGIFVACAAGNDGPDKGSVGNVAPWVTTVGAGTLDRRFPAYISLGNGKNYTGVSLYSGEGMSTEMRPLIYNVSNGAKDKSSNLCLPRKLNSSLVGGKVVICDVGQTSRVEKSLAVKNAGGAALILVDTSAEAVDLIADSHLLPTVAVGRTVGDLIKEYVQRDKNPTAVTSFAGTVVDVEPSPVVGAFSSRGPNAVAAEILKPDLIGPGLNILAAWTELAGPTGLQEDERRTRFNIKSGTSMSCPHIAGVAALIKAAHPNWSPSAIKSALMTTAYTLDNTKSPLRDAAGGGSTPYAHGAGHVNPQKALSPGLIYNITAEDYINYLCYYYFAKDMEEIVRRPNITCDHGLKDPGNLNYPSFSIQFSDSQTVVTYSRELTNVGTARSVYKATVGGPTNVGVTVSPRRLAFEEVGQKLRYNVTFLSKKTGNWTDDSFGWITWSSKQHQVRSPITYGWRSSGGSSRIM